jgi:hypothetical protein
MIGRYPRLNEIEIPPTRIEIIEAANTNAHQGARRRFGWLSSVSIGIDATVQVALLVGALGLLNLPVHTYYIDAALPWQLEPHIPFITIGPQSPPTDAFFPSPKVHHPRPNGELDRVM